MAVKDKGRSFQLEGTPNTARRIPTKGNVSAPTAGGIAVQGRPKTAAGIPTKGRVTAPGKPSAGSGFDGTPKTAKK